MNEKKLLGEKDAARFLGLSVFTLRNWRHQVRGPAYVRLGLRAIRYRLTDLEDFVDSSRIRRAGR